MESGFNITNAMVVFSCHGSGENVRLPIEAFHVPPGVVKNLYSPVSMVGFFSVVVVLIVFEEKEIETLEVC